MTIIIVFPDITGMSVMFVMLTNVLDVGYVSTIEHTMLLLAIKMLCYRMPRIYDNTIDSDILFSLQLFLIIVIIIFSSILLSDKSVVK